MAYIAPVSLDESGRVVFRLSVRPRSFVRSSGQILLPSYLMNHEPA